MTDSTAGPGRASHEAVLDYAAELAGHGHNIGLIGPFAAGRFKTGGGRAVRLRRQHDGDENQSQQGRQDQVPPAVSSLLRPLAVERERQTNQPLSRCVGFLVVQGPRQENLFPVRGLYYSINAYVLQQIRCVRNITKTA